MGAARAKEPATATNVGIAREFLERLARILVRCGHSPQELRREFQRICDALQEPKRHWDPAELGYLMDLPHVIAYWYGDPQYLDSRGAPLARLPNARGPSLFSPVARALPEVDPKAAARSLMRLRAVYRHRGRYLPSGRQLLVSEESGFVQGLTALLGMLRTVERNVSGPKGKAVLQRCAFNPSFPA